MKKVIFVKKMQDFSCEGHLLKIDDKFTGKARYF